MRGRSDGPREGRGKSLEIFEWEGGHFRRSSSGFGQVTVAQLASTARLSSMLSSRRVPPSHLVRHAVLFLPFVGQVRVPLYFPSHFNKGLKMAAVACVA